MYQISSQYVKGQQRRGRKAEWTDGQTDGRTDGHTEGQTTRKPLVPRFHRKGTNNSYCQFFVCGYIS